MSPAAAQALADSLPILVCGEESAELAFGDALLTLEQHGLAHLRQSFLTIVADEHRHGVLLSALRGRLPSPTPRAQARRAAQFLKRLASHDVAIHLARMAALDVGVCCVLAELCRSGRPVALEPELATVFNAIRRDEGRHVRITRASTAALRLAADVELAERKLTLQAFINLLEPYADAFAVLGVDLTILRQRLSLAACQKRRLLVLDPS